MSDDRLVKLATLWQRRSKAGKTYFSGFMGDVSLVMFRGDEIERNGEQIQTWRLFVQERAPARRPAPKQIAPAMQGVPYRVLDPVETTPIPDGGDPLPDDLKEDA